MSDISNKKGQIVGDDPTSKMSESSAKGTMLQAALQYHASGLRVTTWKDDPDPQKQFQPWKKYGDGQTVDQINQLLNKPFDRIAILTGIDGLEGIDIDTKADPLKTIDKEYFDLIKQEETAAAALAKCVIVHTKSGGWHIIYRAANIGRNAKLTKREGVKQAVIETRGIGGLLFVAPSPGYEVRQGCYTKIQTLTNEERDSLVSIARLLSHREQAEAAGIKDEVKKEYEAAELTPWDDFNARHDVREIAEKYGWTFLYESGGKEYFNRPGNPDPKKVGGAILKTTHGNRVLYPFSTGTSLDAEKCYSPFGIYAAEEHRNDSKAAAKELRKQWYGKPNKEKEGKEGFSSALEIRNGRYVWTGEKNETEISNFIVKPGLLIEHPTQPKRVFSVVNIHGESKEFVALAKDLASAEGFKAIVEGGGNFIGSFNSRQYSAIKELWYFEEKKAVEVTTLGAIPGTNLYAWAKGIFDGDTHHQVDEYGIVEVGGTRYFISVFSSINANDTTLFNNERRFLHKPNDTTFEQWATLVNNAFSEAENGMIGVVFACAALFRGIITSHTNNFPLLFLFGQRATGKSTFRDMLLSLFGIPQEAISLGSSSSPKGFSRKLAQSRDAILCLEEYKNTINPALIEMLKSVYDGIGYERAMTTNDNRTHSTPVLSSVVVCGQELPTKENALFSRTVTLEFASTKFTPEQIAAYNTLVDLQNGEGVTGATLEMLKCRPHIEAEFVAKYRELCKWLKDNRMRPNEAPGDLDAIRLPANVEERSIGNTAIFLSVYSILERHLNFPFTYEQLLTTIVSKLKVQVEIMANTTDVSQFWSAFVVLASRGTIAEGRDYKVDGAKGSETVYFYPATVFSAYAEHQKRVGGQTLDGATLTRYLKTHPGFKPGEKGDTHVVWLAKSSRRCIAFDLKSTNIDLIFSPTGVI